MAIDLKKIFFLFSFLFLFGPAAANEGCGKSADACTAAPKSVLPFAAEVAKAGLAPRAAVKTSTGSAENTAADPAAAVKKETFSKPLWLLVMGGLLAGLYWFLKEGKKKRGK